MYHYISSPPGDADAIRHDLSLPPELFEEQLKWLKDNGYETITLEDLVLALETGYELPPKPIILTMDDGYRDTYTNAYPLLLKYGMKATIFVITSLLDTNNVNYITWDMAVEMSNNGISIASHTVDHPELVNRSAEFLMHQLRDSKLAIEAHTLQTVRIFCYPSGDYDSSVIELLPQVGYWAAVDTMQGTEHTSDNLWELTRVRIRGYFGAAQLESVLNAY